MGMRFGSKTSRRRGNSSQDSNSFNGGGGNSNSSNSIINMASMGRKSSTSGSSPMSRMMGTANTGGSSSNNSNSNSNSTSTSTSNTSSDIPTTSVEFASSKTGYLTKRAMSSMDAFANWKERFFVLAEGRLSYYKQGGGFFQSKDDIAHLKGEIELTSDSLVRKSGIDERANCFEVLTPSKKMFAQASTAKEMEDWIKSIRSHINVLQRQQQQGRGSFQEMQQQSLNATMSNVASATSAASIAHAPGSTGGGGSGGSSGGSGGGSTSSTGMHAASMLEDYSRPSLLEDHELVRGVDKSSDPKDIVIKQLLEENRQLREQLALKDQVIHELETHGRANSVDLLSLSGNAGGGSGGGMGGSIGGSIGGGRSAANSRGPGAPKLILDLRDVKKKQFQLFDAAELGNTHLINTLLRDNVVDVNGVGVNQCTALHLAARNNHARAVRELLARGADPSVRNGDSFNALHLAAKAGNHLVVEELLAFGADPNTTDFQGNGAIHMAAESGNIAVAKALIARGARIDSPNASGSLPVHLSPIGHPIRVLLGSGANLAATNPSQPPRPPRARSPNENATEVSHIAFKNKYQKDLALGPRDFEFVKVLGRGAFAKVYLVRGKGSNKDKWYALKAYNKQAIVQKNQAQYIHTEKAALQACSDHPYIVTLYYAFQSKDRLFLVMEYCGGGDLLSALTRRKAFSESEAAFYIGEIALALSHLHSKNIVFRDLKPENVVMDLEGHCLLTDFGISKEGIKDHTSASTFCGSPMYLAPEMLSRSGHGFALDWYSVGALLFELLTGLPPFYTNDKKQLFHNILRGHLVIPEYLSANARDLILRLLHRDPKQRLGSGPRGDREIFEHPFFRGIDWELMMRREISPPFRPKVSKDPAGMPDTSNFPQAFTDQEISDIERGFESAPSDEEAVMQRVHRTSSSSRDERRLFKDFDFTPEVQLDSEAKQFEKLAMENSARSFPAPKLLESDEYSI